jgi:hypothetical protein
MRVPGGSGRFGAANETLAGQGADRKNALTGNVQWAKTMSKETLNVDVPGSQQIIQRQNREYEAALEPLPSSLNSLGFVLAPIGEGCESDNALPPWPIKCAHRADPALNFESNIEAPYLGKVNLVKARARFTIVGMLRA